MFNFLGYKLANGVTVYIGEIEPSKDGLDGICKEYAIVTKNSDSDYTRGLSNDVIGEVYLVGHYKGAVELEECIELAKGKYGYNDSARYGDINHGILVPAAELSGGEWVSVPTADVLDKKVVSFKDYIDSLT